jgi:hypothetical protein
MAGPEESIRGVERVVLGAGREPKYAQRMEISELCGTLSSFFAGRYAGLPT